MRFHEMKKQQQKAKQSASQKSEQEAAATVEVSEEAKKAQAEQTQNQVTDQVEVEATAETVEAQVNQEDENSQNEVAEQEEEVSSQVTESQQLQEMKEQMVRILADNQNIKRRAEADRFRFFEEAKIRYIGMFLPVFDDLSRSLDASTQFDVPEGFLDGLKLVNKKFQEIFEKEKVERIDQTGIPFDVELHEALMRQATPDQDTPSDTVIQVFEPGYKIGGKIVKHAKVIVSE